MKTVNFCDFSGANHIEGQREAPKKTRKGAKNMSREKQSRNRKEKIQRKKRELLEAFMEGRSEKKSPGSIMKVTLIQPPTSLSEMLKNFIPDKVSRSCLACQMSAVRVLKGRRGISPFVKKPGTAERSRTWLRTE